jgi:fatty-acyl-CoA synthase
VLGVLPMFHVGGLCIQVLPALLAGGVLRLHARFDPQAWIEDVAGWRPTTSLLVPATLRAVVALPAWPGADLRSLEFVNAGSSVVPLTLIESLHRRGVPVCQVYGSTETGPFSIALRRDDALAHAGSVGTPAPGVAIRLVDAEGRDVGDGDVGEILVSGDNVMRGYHRDPANPSFRDGWFHSGDLARRGLDGFFEVVGRSKDMIISGGENIYPAEIENLVAELPEVAECVVVGLPDERWGEVPVLVVVAAAGRAPDERRIRDALAGRLARFKHPRDVIVVDDLPRTALGKVRKDALARRLLDLRQA